MRGGLLASLHTGCQGCISASPRIGKLSVSSSRAGTSIVPWSVEGSKAVAHVHLGGSAVLQALMANLSALHGLECRGALELSSLAHEPGHHCQGCHCDS